jgi:hypothetical protein
MKWRDILNGLYFVALGYLGLMKEGCPLLWYLVVASGILRLVVAGWIWWDSKRPPKVHFDL